MNTTLNADGFGTLNAAGDNVTNLDEIKSKCEKETSGTYACSKWQKGLFKGSRKAPTICEGKINACVKKTVKDGEKLAESKISTAIGKSLEQDVNENTGAGLSLGNTGGGDNTMMYVAIGGGLLLLAGAAFFMLRKPAAATPITN